MGGGITKICSVRRRRSLSGEEVNRIIYTPRTGEEVQNAVAGHPPIYLYSNLCEEMKRCKNPTAVIKRIFAKSLKNFILIQSPRKPNSGHWCGLSMNPYLKDIYFFSSYGGKPDEEKNRWISRYGQILSGQDANLLNDGLKGMMNEGWRIHYNQYPYQMKGDKTATCGIWAAGFLNSNANPDEFFLHCSKYGITAVDIYKRYFM